MEKQYEIVLVDDDQSALTEKERGSAKDSIENILAMLLQHHFACKHTNKSKIKQHLLTKLH